MEESPPMLCPACNKETSDKGNFCQQCGQRIRARRALLWAIAAVYVLILVGLMWGKVIYGWPVYWSEIFFAIGGVGAILLRKTLGFSLNWSVLMWVLLSILAVAIFLIMIVIVVSMAMPHLE
jgi:Kef-type K+ transport system membrane component KefB